LPNADDLKKLCGVLEDSSGWSTKPTGTSLVYGGATGAARLDTCVFSIPKNIVSNIRLTPDGYPAVKLGSIN
jgi:hypothetical protein